MPDSPTALKPEDLTRLFVERANQRDAGGIAALYEDQAVMAYPPGSQTVGRDAIRALWETSWPTRHASSRKHRCRPGPAVTSRSPPPHRTMAQVTARRQPADNPTAPGCVSWINYNS